jgi:hypothetical protein
MWLTEEAKLERIMLTKSWTKRVDGATVTFSPNEDKFYMDSIKCTSFTVYKQNDGEEHSWKCPSINISTRATRADVEERHSFRNQPSDY